MKMFSWNVNGLNSCIEKGFFSFFNFSDADFFCIQETKYQKELPAISGYYQFWNYCSKKGYSGTAIFTKYKPISVASNLAKFFKNIFPCISKPHLKIVPNIILGMIQAESVVTSDIVKKIER